MILISDTHLTSSPRDSYRWDLFPWLRKQVEKYDVKQIVHCGDLTDSKDRHSAELVNRVVYELTELSKICDVLVLFGNHDGIDVANPFFGFIERFETNVTFIFKITEYWLQIGNHSFRSLFLPCTKNWSQDWQKLDFTQYQFIFTHTTYTGSKSETGIELQGIPPSVFADTKAKVYSGDIHVPQKIGKNIEYIGAPYRIRFGDTFTPRIILIDDHGQSRNLYFPCISKHTIVVTSIADIDLESKRLNIKPKDQVKVRVRLPRSQFPNWDNIKEQIREIAIAKEWELFGPELHHLQDQTIKRAEIASYKSSSDVVRDYGKAKKFTPDQINVGLSIINNL